MLPFAGTAPGAERPGRRYRFARGFRLRRPAASAKVSRMGWFEERSGLVGTVAVVTGGAGGLGEAISRDLAANGVHVAVIDIDGDAAGALADALGPDVAIVRHGDARDPEQLGALFAAVDERWGRVDTLVNVVGGTFGAPFVDRPRRVGMRCCAPACCTCCTPARSPCRACQAGGPAAASST